MAYLDAIVATCADDGRALVSVVLFGSNPITFASFTNNSFDQASPVDQITYTLAPLQ